MEFLSHQIKSLSDYLSFMHLKIDFDELEFWKYLNQIIIQKIPIARISLKTWFYGLNLIIDSNVFIPKNETELVVEITIKKIKLLQLEHKTYFDICCGCGAIGLAVSKHFLTLKTSFNDINKYAILNTKKNIKQLNLKIDQVIQGKWQKVLKQFDPQIITANFPYVSKLDHIDPLLLDYEPHKALFASNNGWTHYQQLIKHLKENKYWKLVVLEVSSFHEIQWKKVVNNFLDWNISLDYDLANHLRVVSIIKKT